jgi:hypothetical protein
VNSEQANRAEIARIARERNGKLETAGVHSFTPTAG